MAGRDGSALPGEWLTPNVPNGGRSVSPELVASKGMTEAGEKRTVGLESQSKHWATPDSNTSSYSNGHMGPNIREQAAAWPSPRATDGSKGGPNQRGSKGDLMLPSMAAQWPTPKSITGGANSNREARGAGGPDLQEASQTWPTPNAHDGRRPGADLYSTQGANLSRDAATWPTPSARDHKSEMGGQQQ